LNTAESLRAGASWVRAIASYVPWRLRYRRASHGRVPAGDISIFYRRYGAGDPVLLLHGGFMLCESWLAQVPGLADGYQVVAMDSRGHGRTTLGSRRLTYRQLGRDAAAFIEAMGIGPANLVGTSDGGTAALHLAIERPDLVSSVALLGTPFNTANYTPGAWRAIHRFLRPRSPALLFTRCLRRVLSPERGTWGVFYEMMKEMWLTLPDLTVEDLGRIRAPVLVVGCDRDEFLSGSDDPLRVFRQTARAIPGARLVVIEGGTHTVNLDMPAVTTDVILGFLRGLPARV